MPGEVNLRCTLNKPNLPVTGGQQLAYVLIEAMPAASLSGVQMPLNFALVLDHSGSMSGEKLNNLKAAAKLAVDQMGPQDYVSVIIFDDKVKVITPCQPATDRSAIQQQIDSIRDGGGTTISKGMKSGLGELRKALDPNRVNRMLLLTDGETFGDAKKCVKLASELGQMGVPVYALGLGEDWNEKLLDEIATKSGGLSDFIDQPAKITRVFEDMVSMAKGTVVQNAQMVLRLVTGVSPRAVWQVLPIISKLDHRVLSDRDVQVDLGDMEKDQGQSVLVELLVPPRQEGRYRIAQAEVSYDVPAMGLVGEKVKVDILMNFTSDPQLAQQTDPRVMNIIEKVTAHKLQTRALDEAAMGNIVAATQKLRAAATRLLDMGETELAQTALQEAERLEQGGQMSAAGTKKLRYETRKLTQKLDEVPEVND